MATVLEFNAALLPRGPFDLSASYETLNFVESGGSGYVCLQPCSGIPVTNTAYWFKFVHKGDPGTPFTYADLTPEQKAELAHDATIAAQAAQAAAEQAAQKFAAIKDAIDALDPSQSTSDAIVAEAAARAANDAELESTLGQLGPKIDQVAQEVDEIDGVDNTITPEWTGSKRIEEGGTIINSGSSFSISDYIPVRGSVTTKIYGAHGYNNGNDIKAPTVHLYDSSKTYLGYIYTSGETDITAKIVELDAAFVRLSHFAENSSYPLSGVYLTEFSEPKYASYEALKQATAYVTPASVVQLEMFSGLIGSADGIPYANHPDALYTQAYPCSVGKTFRMTNVAGVTLVARNIYYYNGSTYVGVKAIGTTIGDYTTIAASSTYDNIRFGFQKSSGSAFESTSDILVETDKAEEIITLKSVVEGQQEQIESQESRIEELEDAGGEGQAILDYINRGYRAATNDDFTQSVSGKFKIENGSLYGQRVGTDPCVMMVFNEGIKAIEFEIASLWDSNLLTLVFGVGVDTGSNNKLCFAECYLPTSQRPNDIGYVMNKDVDGNASASENSSVWGQGHFSGNYRQPQLSPTAVAVGDKCRIELIDGHYFKASIYNSTTGTWTFWWVLDANGDWNNPNRLGWSTRKAIGFAIQFASITTWKELVKNVKVTYEEGKTSSVFSDLAKNYTIKRQWVAIGDSITEIDKNNGLSYVSNVARAIGYAPDNQGHGGWTIYKLWRDRETIDWESAVSALNDGDVVSILAGTNDFDTAAFFIPSTDEAMDASGNPHPRFGTTDPSSEDAKDTHTTLGCLRLMIERILTLKPSARLVVFAPFYREKGSLIGSTGWEKLYVNSDGKTIYDYADAIYSVAKEYNLPAYNTCRECGISPMTLATFTYDDLHINQLGGELIGNYVAKRLIQLA